MNIKTTLKLAKIAVEKYSEQSTKPGFIINQNGQKIKVKFTELVEALSVLTEEDVAIVKRCKDCENWNKAPNAKKGHCFPQCYDRQRGAEDFCSAEYVIRSKESRYVDEAIRKFSPEK